MYLVFYHNLKKVVVILVLLLGIGVSNALYSQEGGKKKEKYARKGAKRGNFHLTQYKSRGHADEFARGSGRKGIFSRLFKKKDSPTWVNKSSGSKRSHYKANRYLFTRDRSKGKAENEQITTKQNAERERNRDRGNKTFKFKKYRRK